MKENMFSLKNKIALVTGGAGLLAAEFAIALREFGATVILADINIDGCNKNIERINLDGIESATLDVTSKDNWEKVLEEIINKYNKIDILVNSAAFTNQTKTSSFNKTFENVELDDWNKMLDVNLTGSFLGCQAVSKYMINQKSGSIINIASLYGLVSPNHKMYPGTGIVQPVAYTVSKHGIIGLTKYAATWLAEKGIRVNSITPGGIYNNHDELFLERFSNLSPNGRMTEKEELRGAIVYLASEASSSVVGHNLVVDGGWTVW
ncbi:SDR family oxidoreductase [Poseidonibacter ostreae]|uniref:SDR family oxidoreductase n=1 Tax=Poseidonibacter ostreae TaxID=2654171 RepID=UPI0012658C74|nr:SDR family oxidoreductase [Poseidonibacter ostreae]KAB7884538.1 SDR family oxidoreductase [Poseidonibacter ostreae]